MRSLLVVFCCVRCPFALLRRRRAPHHTITPQQQHNKDRSDTHTMTTTRHLCESFVSRDRPLLFGRVAPLRNDDDAQTIQAHRRSPQITAAHTDPTRVVTLSSPHRPLHRSVPLAAALSCLLSPAIVSPALVCASLFARSDAHHTGHNSSAHSHTSDNEQSDSSRIQLGQQPGTRACVHASAS